MRDDGGVTGSNPVVAMAFEKLSGDPYSNVRLSIGRDGKVMFEAGSEFAAPAFRSRQADPATFRKLAKDLRELRVAAGAIHNQKCNDPVHRHAPTEKMIWIYRDGQEGQVSSERCRDDASVALNDAIATFKRNLDDPQWLEGLPEFYAGAMRPMS